MTTKRVFYCCCCCFFVCLFVFFFCIFLFCFIFSVCVFLYEHSQFTNSRGRGGCFLSPLYHFHPPHRHYHINRDITAESSPQHSQQLESNLEVSCFECKSLTFKSLIIKICPEFSFFLYQFSRKCIKFLFVHRTNEKTNILEIPTFKVTKLCIK